MRINAAMNLSSMLWRILIVLLCFSIKLYSLQIKRRGLLTVKPAKLFLIGSNLTVYCHPEKCKNGFKLSLEVNGETVTSSEEVNCPAIFNLINFRTPFSSVICMLKGPDSSKIVDGGDLYGGLPPDKPENIICETTRSSDNIICSWEKGQKTHVITTYNISLNRGNGTRLELYQIQDDEQRVSANPLTISRAVIEENIKYKLIITAYNHFGESQSDPFIFCLKDIVIPETPRIVHIEFENNSQAAVLQWETSNSSEHLRSDVRLCTDKAPSWVKSNYKAEGADLNEGLIRVSGLRPLTDYEFQMRTCMPYTNTPRLNCSKWSASVRGRSPGKGPSQQLHVWRTFDSPGSNVTVLWKPPSPEDYSGVVQQYKIFLGNEQKQLSGPASSSVPVPAEIKTISISAITSYGTSPPAVVPLKHSGGFAPVLRELAPAANSSAVLVSWTWTDDKHWSTSDPLHYVVQWTTVPGAQMKWQRVSKDQNNTLITALRAGVRYNVSLYVVTSRGVSAPSSRLVYSKEQKPVSGPNLSVLVHKSRRVHIQWDELPVDQQRGFITHYTVYLQTLYSSNTKLSVTVSGSGPRILWLDCPEGALAVQLSASTSAGEGQPGNRIFSQPESPAAGLVIGIVFVITLFLAIVANLMCWSCVRKRIKQKCISWGPAWLDENLPKLGNSNAIRLLKEFGSEPSFSSTQDDPPLSAISFISHEERDDVYPTIHVESSQDTSGEPTEDTPLLISDRGTMLFDSQQEHGYKPQISTLTPQQEEVKETEEEQRAIPSSLDEDSCVFEGLLGGFLSRVEVEPTDPPLELNLSSVGALLWSKTPEKTNVLNEGFLLGRRGTENNVEGESTLDLQESEMTPHTTDTCLSQSTDEITLTGGYFPQGAAVSSPARCDTLS
ncbi:interleukin-23 receptor isoform X1 [Gymnodraco acuticeps]|uniref:Interleukin-23 receptor isoform X1 n=2 Tax=Gymnodraco acuticeps TaxID=8218 RepID=A0A6P8V6V0_GYMAC|nr:interleukin-23 receptor isoform X1 [Gymnodraco acuticeps]XP_034085591.1 interleukin-23 receptor isoform X1 [Gymnodraco acuticeps]